MQNKKQIIPYHPSNGWNLKGIPEGIIYHYTSLKVLKCILGSGQLLMTHWRDFAHQQNGDANEIIQAAQEYDRFVAPFFWST